MQRFHEKVNFEKFNPGHNFFHRPINPINRSFLKSQPHTHASVSVHLITRITNRSVSLGHLAWAGACQFLNPPPGSTHRWPTKVRLSFDVKRAANGQFLSEFRTCNKLSHHFFCFAFLLLHLTANSALRHSLTRTSICRQLSGPWLFHRPPPPSFAREGKLIRKNLFL